MKYLVEGSLKWPLRAPPNKYQMMVGSLGSSAIESVTLEEIDKFGTLGVGLSTVMSYGVATRHDVKTAALHKYVLSAITEIRRAGESVLAADVPVCGFEKVYGCTDLSGQDIFINTTYSCLEVCGLLGSVAIWSAYRNEPEVVQTLYDFLGWFCKRANVNLMKYRDLVFYSDERSYVTTIRLDQSVEGSRFFTKMIMDVMG